MTSISGNGCRTSISGTGYVSEVHLIKPTKAVAEGASLSNQRSCHHTSSGSSRASATSDAACACRAHAAQCSISCDFRLGGVVSRAKADAPAARPWNNLHWRRQAVLRASQATTEAELLHVPGGEAAAVAQEGRFSEHRLQRRVFGKVWLMLERRRSVAERGLRRRQAQRLGLGLGRGHTSWCL
jgi:hypothetical protein